MPCRGATRSGRYCGWSFARSLARDADALSNRAHSAAVDLSPVSLEWLARDALSPGRRIAPSLALLKTPVAAHRAADARLRRNRSRSSDAPVRRGPPPQNLSMQQSQHVTVPEGPPETACSRCAGSHRRTSAEKSARVRLFKG